MDCNFLTLVDCKKPRRQINGLPLKLRLITRFLQCKKFQEIMWLDAFFEVFLPALHFSEGRFF